MTPNDRQRLTNNWSIFTVTSTTHGGAKAENTGPLLLLSHGARWNGDEEDGGA